MITISYRTWYSCRCVHACVRAYMCVCSVCMYVCVFVCPWGSHQMSCAITAHLIPMRKRLSGIWRDISSQRASGIPHPSTNSMLPAPFPPLHMGAGGELSPLACTSHVLFRWNQQLHVQAWAFVLRVWAVFDWQMEGGRDLLWCSWGPQPSFPLLCLQCRVAAIIVEDWQGEKEVVSSNSVPGHLRSSNSCVCPGTSRLCLLSS